METKIDLKDLQKKSDLEKYFFQPLILYLNKYYRGELHTSYYTMQRVPVCKNDINESREIILEVDLSLDEFAYWVKKFMKKNFNFNGVLEKDPDLSSAHHIILKIGKDADPNYSFYINLTKFYNLGHLSDSVAVGSCFLITVNKFS